MILNYNEDSGFNSILTTLQSRIPDISKEVEGLFKKINPEKRFSALLDAFYEVDSFKDTTFKTWVDGLNDTEIASMTAGGALEKYKGHLKDIGQQVSPLQKVGTTLKNIGATVGSFALNAGTIMLVSAAIEGLFALEDALTTTSSEAWANAEGHLDASEALGSEITSISSQLGMSQEKNIVLGAKIFNI